LSNHGVVVVKQIIPKNTFETIPKDSFGNWLGIFMELYGIQPIALFLQSMNQLTFTVTTDIWVSDQLLSFHNQ